MFTAKPQKNLRDAKQYFRAHLAQGDYYSERQQVMGLWLGKGVERLGLSLNAPVKEEQFARLCDNLHPVSAQLLTVRRRVKNHRIYYDFTNSAPKSVSIMALMVGDKRIIAAHDEAGREAMLQMEKMAAARVRLGGQRNKRITGEIVAAVFQHDTSRALDPQLHTHFIIFNATWDAVELRWKALETGVMFERINYFTEVYRNALARQLRGLGYRIRNSAHGFEIEGVKQTIIDRYSKRRRAIVDAEPVAVIAVNKKLRAKLEKAVHDSAGKPPEILAKAEKALREFKPITELTNTGRSNLAHSTRQWKDTNLDPAEVLAYQRSQLSDEEFNNLRGLTQQQPSPVETKSESVSAAQAIDYARDHLFERNSVVPLSEILREALAFSRGRVELAQLESELVIRDEFLAVNEMLTTRETLAQEKRMIELTNQGMGVLRPLNLRFNGNAELSGEQRQAVQFIMKSNDRFVGLRGGAGTGKTHLLKEVVRGIEESNATVLLAPTTGAVEALRKEGLPHAASIQRFLGDEAFQQDAVDKVMVVDEAGLLSRRDMLALLEFANRHNSRIIFSGDTRQHSGIEAGDALRLLEQRSTLRVTEVRQIVRQINLEYREAIAELARGEGLKALARLERLGAVEEIEGAKRYKRLASEYVSAAKAKKSALVVSPTWREIEQATERIRELLKAERMLEKQDTVMTIFHGLKWTRAQKRDLRNYYPGLALNFYRKTSQFAKGENAEVLKVEGDALQVKHQNGRVLQITKKQTDCFEVMEKRDLPVAAGERLLLQASRKKEKLFNGQIVTVKEIKPDGGLLLADGRSIPPSFKTFTHGYSVTSFSSQGRSVDRVLVAMDAQSVQAAHRNQFYVSVSRGREQVKIFTDDAQFLRAIVTRPGGRLSAIELLESKRLTAEVSVKQQKAVNVRVSL